MSNSTPEGQESTERRTTRATRRSSTAAATLPQQEEQPSMAADAKPEKEELEGMRCEVWYVQCPYMP